MSDLNHIIAAAEEALHRLRADEARQRQVNEERFDSDLRDYLNVDDTLPRKRFKFGGAVNLLTTCADILRKHDRHDEADIFDRAAMEIER